MNYTRFINYNEIITKAKLCRVCYSKSNTFNISKNNMMNIYNNYIYINETKTNSICYIFYNKNNIDICFKGTSNINDLCFNLNIYPKQFLNNKIRIHSGFLNKYLSIKSLIIKNINKIIHENDIKEICFNGHSSGGAIANIASLDLSNLYKNTSIKCITFGSPRVGNNHFINEYNKNIKLSLRVVNKYDIIQYLPPIPIYKHNHKALLLLNNKEFTLFQIVKNIYTYLKYNHGMSKYIKNLSII